MTCAGNPVSLTSSGSPANFWTFTLSGLGSTGQQGCAYVTMDKTNLITVVTSKGYNNPSCIVSANTVERQLEVRY